MIIPFSRLDNSNLIAGAVYEGGNIGNISDDPLARLLKGGNAGAFRFCGAVAQPKYLMITISTDDPEWTDTLNPESGVITCFGDHREPGQSIHNTPKHGNLILRNLFKSLHSPKQPRGDIPPVFIFEKKPNKTSPRSVRFVGLCAPGAPGIQQKKDLTRIHRQMDGRRFQNYRAMFTILDIPVVQRTWINDLEAGITHSPHRPIVWQMWQNSGLYRPLRRNCASAVRPVAQQLPSGPLGKAMLLKLYRYFASKPYQFLQFAYEIFAMTDPRISLDRIRRAAPDNTYTIVGNYRMGLDADPVQLGFVLESKCYNPGTGTRKRRSIGNKEIVKLLSRLKHRQFGVLVTTSVVAPQIYADVKKQNRPIVCITGSDMIDILRSIRIDSVKKLGHWLRDHYAS